MVTCMQLLNHQRLSINFGLFREIAGANDAVIAVLALQPTDRVLEVGFGHGRTLDRVARQLTAGFAAGVDLSETMVRMTARHCRDLITDGRVMVSAKDSSAAGQSILAYGPKSPIAESYRTLADEILAYAQAA